MQIRNFTLIGFFRLLLRHKMLIVMTMAVITAIILVIYVLLPVFGLTFYRQPSAYQARLELPLPSYPTEAIASIDFDVPTLATAEFRNTTHVYEAYLATIGIPGSLNEAEASHWVRSNVVPSLSSRWNARSRTLVVTYDSTDPEQLVEFLDLLASNVRQVISTRVNDLLRLNQTNLAEAEDALAQHLAQSLEILPAQVSDAISQAFVSDTPRLLEYLRVAVREAAINTALESNVLPWPADRTATVIEQPDDSLLASRGRGMALLFLMGIVFSVLLVIFADYVRYARTTPEGRPEPDRVTKAGNR